MKYLRTQKYAKNKISLVLLCFICTLVIQFVIVPQKRVHAQSAIDIVLNAPENQGAIDTVLNATQPTDITTPFAPGAAPTAAATPGASTGAAVKVNPPNAADADSSTGWFTKFVGDIILSIASYAAWFTGVFLDGVMTMVVINMNSLLTGTTGVMDAINNSWKIIRDICNLAFIFGFVWIGIRTILSGIDDSGTKRMLSSLIIGAILINFSLFFTKVVVDISNALAVETYNTISQGNPHGIGIGFMKSMNLVTINQTTGAWDWNNFTGPSMGFYLGASLLLMIASYSFIAAGIMLLIRLVGLILIMIFSPVLFAATVFSNMHGYASMLWKKLFGYAFYAPVYLLLVLVSYRIVEAFSNRFATAGLSAALNNTSSFDAVIVFVIASIFMVATVSLANKFAMAGGGQAVSIGRGWARGAGGMLGAAAGGATFGLAARAGRSTLGWGGSKFAKSELVQRNYNKGGLKGFVARRASDAGTKLAESSFDARRIHGVGKSLGIGEGKKGGFAQTVKDKEKAEKKYMDRLEPDTRVYDDLGVANQLSSYENAIEERNDTLRELSMESDEAVRATLTRRSIELQEQISDMENAKKDVVPEWAKRRMNTWGLTSEEEQINEWNNTWLKFAGARDLAKNMPKEMYAANLERRAWFWGGRTRNRNAAGALRKDVKKSPDDKLLDAIKGIPSSSSPAPH